MDCLVSLLTMNNGMIQSFQASGMVLFMPFRPYLYSLAALRPMRREKRDRINM